ncbi:MAG TPA: hypothetical protein VGO80_10825 [Solirubrobacteraceae bacterium]|nr:hypothetical protein [Solirubrobacteraceae bacterium]
MLVAALLVAGPAGAHHRDGSQGHDDPQGRDDPRGRDDQYQLPPGGMPQPPYVPGTPVTPQPPYVPGTPVAPVDPSQPLFPTTTAKTVVGRVAMLRTDGRAAIPISAPKSVRQIIRMANQIVGKPYKWGGGHAGLGDSGYDCSGAVSYALIKAGLQRSSMVSGTFRDAYAKGAGRYVSIYANSKHVYLEVAGLRLDTSPYGDLARQSGVRWRPVVGLRSGFARRHPVGL